MVVVCFELDLVGMGFCAVWDWLKEGSTRVGFLGGFSDWWVVGFGLGLRLGLVFIPVGCVVGVLWAGFSSDFQLS